MIKPATVADIVGADLSLFHIEIMIEVYRTDVDERKTESIGFFKLQAIATEFAKRQSDAHYCKTGSAFVLTDGVTGFVISDQLPITIMDDRAEAKPRTLAATRWTPAKLLTLCRRNRPRPRSGGKKTFRLLQSLNLSFPRMHASLSRELHSNCKTAGPKIQWFFI